MLLVFSEKHSIECFVLRKINQLNSCKSALKLERIDSQKEEMSGESSKQTGGGGFKFEDEVTAAFCLYLLEGTPPLAPDLLGPITNIEFQAKGGWLFDDLIVTTVKDGITSKLACSIKSFPIVNEACVEAEQVDRAWKELLGQTTSGFNQSNDHLVLLGAPPTQKAHDAFNELLAEARTGDPKTFADKLSTATKRSQYKSLECPVTASQTAEKQLYLASRLLYRVYDFENPTSFSMEDVLKRSGNLLEMDIPAGAKNLFDKLCRIASHYRTTGGTLTYSKLVKEIGPGFALKVPVQFSRELEIVEKHTDSRLRRIDSSIGGEVTVSRTELSKELRSALSKHSVIYVRGRSGSGKSALIRTVLEGRKSRTLFIDCGEDCNSDFKALLSLRHSLRSLLENLPTEEFCVVLDSLERARRDQTISILKAELKDLAKTSGPRVRILISCEEDQYDYCQAMFGPELAEIGPKHTFQMPNFSDAELEEVLSKIPHLRFLSAHSEIRSLIRVPKIIDLVSRYLKTAGQVSPSKWIGEGSLVNWLWNGLIKKGVKALGRAILVQEIAEKQADELITRVPLNRLSAVDGELVSELVSERVCREEASTVNFDHDLLGHWARYILLQSQPDVVSFLKQKRNAALWLYAVRLYGQSLIEESEDQQKWISIYEQFLGDPSLQPFADAFLDALYSGPTSAEVLQRALPYLTKDGGKVFKRLLIQFLHRATVPDSRMQGLMQASGDEDLIPHAEAFNRQPIWHLWLGLLPFLHRNKDALGPIAPEEIASICELWLSYTSPSTRLRNEAAELALSVANSWLATDDPKELWRRDSDGIPKKLYRAVLLGAHEQTLAVAEFALKAAGRRVSDEEVKKFEEECTRPKSYKYSIPPSETYLPPWPDGPRAEVDEAFRSVCLESDSLQPLMKVRPDVAKEVILALIIKEPGNRPDDPHLLSDKLELEDPQYFYPPIFFKGPFLGFLRINAEEGIATISAIVDFATARWSERRKGKVLTSTIQNDDGGIVKTWIGNSDVYFWYRDMPHVPHILASALMALEAWLIENLDQGTSIGPLIELAWKSQSLAIAGVLSSICKKDRNLLNGPIGDLAQIFYLHDWEFQFATHNQISNIHLIAWRTPGTNKFMREIAKTWHEAPHRKQDLANAWLIYYLQNPESEFAKKIEVAKKRWKVELDAAEGPWDKEQLTQLLLRFDRTRWKEAKTAEGVQYWRYDAPPEVAAEQAKQLAIAQQMAWLQLVPGNCRPILDGTKSLTEEQLEPFAGGLKQVRDIAQSHNSDLEAPDFQGPLTGIAAVLVGRRVVTWTAKNDALLEDCKTQIIKAASVFVEKATTRDDHSLEKIIWSTGEFAAYGIASLWLKEPSAPKLRKLLSGLLIKAGHGIVRIIVATIYPERSAHQSDFELLMALGMRRAVKLDEFAEDRMKIYRGTLTEQQLTKKIGSWIEAEIEAFVKGQSIGGKIELSSLVETSNQEPEASRVHKLTINADLETVMALHPALFNEDQSRYKVDEADAAQLYNDFVNTVCQVLEPARQFGRPIDDTPNDFERQVLRGCARFIVSAANPAYDSLWKKIIDLGPCVEYWQQDFIHEFIWFGLQQEDRREFIGLWKRILDYADSHPAWSAESKYTPEYRRLDDCWLALMGWDPLMVSIWGKDEVSLITALTKEQERWVSKHLYMNDCLVNFVRFLGRDAAKEIRAKALLPIHAEITKRGKKFWSVNHDKIADDMAHLLTKMHSDNWAEFRGNKELFDVFNTILAELKSQQNRIAMHLSDKVLAGL